MKAVTKVFLLNEEEEKFFGEGPYRLLCMVEETGSLHAGAARLGMAYSKATKLIQNAEKSLGFPLTVRKIGGKSGGGSVLTQEAIDFMKRYELYRNACVEHNKKLYETYFGQGELPGAQFGCVIMASGLGRRFGGDKLMKELCGKPMIQYIVEATEGIFAKRVVVTRNEKVKRWCEERELPVVYHDLPDRNDTIRLGLTALESEGTGVELSGCAFCPADMPFVRKEALREMVTKAIGKTDGIYRMAYESKVGAPVLFGRTYFDSLKELPAGTGGREIIRENIEKVVLIEGKEESELWDMDTPEDFERIQNKMLMGEEI